MYFDGDHIFSVLQQGWWKFEVEEEAPTDEEVDRGLDMEASLVSGTLTCLAKEKIAERDAAEEAEGTERKIQGMAKEMARLPTKWKVEIQQVLINTNVRSRDMKSRGESKAKRPNLSLSSVMRI